MYRKSSGANDSVQKSIPSVNISPFCWRETNRHRLQYVVCKSTSSHDNEQTAESRTYLVQPQSNRQSNTSAGRSSQVVPEQDHRPSPAWDYWLPGRKPAKHQSRRIEQEITYRVEYSCSNRLTTSKLSSLRCSQISDNVADTEIGLFEISLKINNYMQNYGTFAECSAKPRSDWRSKVVVRMHRSTDLFLDNRGKEPRILQGATVFVSFFIYR